MKGDTIIPVEVDYFNRLSKTYVCPDCLTYLYAETCPDCDKIIDWSRAGKEVKE